jgi:hypothetical protein
VHLGTGYLPGMGRQDDDEAAPPTRRPDTGAEVIHGMGLSSEHDEGEVQEVDSREQD